MSITTTNHNGHLYIGYGEENNLPKYIGNFKVYRNCTMQFLTRMFRLSIDIEINGKKRCVNKKSFQEHLNSICKISSVKNNNDLILKQVIKIGYDRFVNNISKAMDGSLNLSKNLGDIFPDKKRKKLLEKLIYQTEINNLHAAKKLIRKGAYIDREYFHIDSHICHNRTETEWFLESRSEKTFYSYTPLAQAIEKGHKFKDQSLAKFIMNIKKDISSDRKQTITYSYTKEYKQVPTIFISDEYYPYNDVLTSITKTIKTIKAEQVSIKDNELILQDCSQEYEKSAPKWMWNDTTTRAPRSGEK